MIPQQKNGYILPFTFIIVAFLSALLLTMQWIELTRENTANDIARQLIRTSAMWDLVLSSTNKVDLTADYGFNVIAFQENNCISVNINWQSQKIFGTIEL